jgi:YidC/Oxa1 family membrane protein insertase
LLQHKIQQKLNPTPPATSGNAPDMSSTNMIMTIFIGFITTTLPAGLVIYWTISNAVTLIQYLMIYRKLGGSAEEVQKA